MSDACCFPYVPACRASPWRPFYEVAGCLSCNRQAGTPNYPLKARAPGE